MQTEPHSETVIIIVDDEPHYVEYYKDFSDVFGIYDEETDSILPLTGDEMEGIDE